MGNMTTYKGSVTTSPQNLYWTRGNMLSHGTVKTGKGFSYKYGPDNLRYRKTVNNVETLYYWDGDVLVGEKTGSDYIIYLYDATGVAGMVYNNQNYYFEKNLFGDVLRVYNSDEEEVAKFTYDSYGNILSQSGTMVDQVKIRYRGYYWDEETGFYYLQSRYYDPSICRFISADQYELIALLSGSLGSLNLYSYCNSNPIMYFDASGNFPILATILSIAALVGMGLTIGGVASGNNTLTAIGLTMVAIPALISGGMAIVAGVGGATYLGIIGGGTVVAGLGTGLFASAEYQQAFTGNNWMLDAGMSEGWYNGLMITVAALATMGTVSCSVLSGIGQMSSPQQMLNSFKNNPNRWKAVKNLIEPSRGKYKGGVSTYSNYINKWTGSKLGIHRIVKGGKYVHGPHIHPWI